MPTLPIPAWLVSYVVTFVITQTVRQIDRFAENFDWALFKSTVEERVRKLLPDWLFEDAVVALINDTIDFAEHALKDEATFGRLLKALAAKDFQGAFEIARKAVADFIASLDKHATPPPAPEADDSDAQKTAAPVDVPAPLKGVAPEKIEELKAKSTFNRAAIRESLVKNAA
jgi:hypothetical protein